MSGAMNKVQEHVGRTLKEAGIDCPSKLVVAASGGLDSTVLLEVLHALGHDLIVAHVNHGTRGEENDGDCEALAAWATQHGCPFEVLTLEAQSLVEGPQGFQGEARKARTAWFEALCTQHKAMAVATGHHADDQAETYVLHAMRSSDPWAVKGMALRDGMRVRPLLGLPKRDLLAHAQCMGWTWREDSSNQSNAYLRNRIRHELLPLMEDLRPGTRVHLNALATRAEALGRLIAPLLEQARDRAEAQPGHWRIEVLTQDAWAREAFQRTLAEEGWSLAGAQRALALLDAQVGNVVEHGTQRVVRERETLVFAVAKARTLPHPVTLSKGASEGETDTPMGTLRWAPFTCPTSTEDLGIHRTWLPAAWLPVTVRPWRHGDRLQPLGMQGQTNVSDVLTQAKVPHAMRPAALVIERENDGCLLWVVGHKVSEQLRLDPTTFEGQSGLTMTFTPAP